MNVDYHIEQVCKVIWEYLVMKQPLEKADCILVFGGHDPSVSHTCSTTISQCLGRKNIVSGGVIHPAAYYGEKEIV